MLPLLALSVALAAPPTVLGVGEAESVVLLLAEGVAERSVRCDDRDGDGLWTCPAGSWPPRLDALGLFIDGKTLLQTRTVTLGDAPAAVSIERVGESLRVSDTAAAPRPGGGPARSGRAALLVEVLGATGGAPRLGLAGDGTQQELACEDGGRFPDRAPNDGVHTCVGLVPDVALHLSLRLSDGVTQDLGTLRWPPELGLRQAKVEKGSAAVASWPVLDRAAASPPRRADAPRVEAPPPGPGQNSPGGGGPSPAALALAGAMAAVLLVAAARLARGPDSAIPNTMALPSAPLFPGAPAGSAVYRVEPGQSASALRWVAEALARSRPVLVLASSAAGSPGAGVLLACLSPDADDVADAALAIGRRAVVPPAVVVPAGALTWAGGLGRTPESVLLQRLAPGAILAVVIESGPAPVALPELALVPFEGQWRTR